MLKKVASVSFVICCLTQTLSWQQMVPAQSELAVDPNTVIEAAQISNKAFEKRMLKFERTAKRIRIDGQARDWARLPRFEDPKGDAKDPSFDVVEVGLVANEKYVDVIIITRGEPSKRNFGICITLDISARHNPDLMVNIKNDQVVARYYDHTDKGQYSLDTKKVYELKNSRMSFGRVVELRLDLKEAATHLKSKSDDVFSAAAKPVFRAQVKCWDGKSYVDVSPLIAAYRFSKKPYDYYGKLPKPVETAHAIDMPLKGRWFLGQGGHTQITHINKWAYDFWLLGPEGSSSRSKPIKSLDQFYCYGSELYAPLEGKVTEIVDGHPDQKPRVFNAKAKSNSVRIQSKEGIDILMSHMLKNSHKTTQNDVIQSGTPVGKIGNSGRSMGPHLDLVAYFKTYKGKETSLPLALKNVRVSINNVDDDPWARDETFWPMREGYFVQSLDEE